MNRAIKPSCLFTCDSSSALGLEFLSDHLDGFSRSLRTDQNPKDRTRMMMPTTIAEGGAAHG